MALRITLRRALLGLANVLIPIACLVFATGFFPYKPLLPGLASFEIQDAREEMGLLSEKQKGTVWASRPAGLFDKVIFMVVDALRSLIRDGAAYPFTAHAAAPTVTMPRVKALTTGSVPSFADLILNLDESDTSSSLASQDTWLAQIREHLHEVSPGSEGVGRIDFFGDDTWLKLFPGSFGTSDGTTSFFVSDFTEVDNNVTRHIPASLTPREHNWDALILHYLGLDHIGHKTGPRGSHMLPKQREMDEIVQQIYSAISTEAHLKNTLLVVAGDHGMNSAGNHGGSSEAETSAALVFISPKLERRSKATKRKPLPAPMSPRKGTEFEYYTKVQQSDLVPTLSVLLDIPIPKNNLGIIIPDILDLYWDKTLHSLRNPYLQLLYRNALQVLEIVKATYGENNFMDLAGQSMEIRRCSYGWVGKRQLQCLWARAQRMMLAASVGDKFTIKDQANALLDFLAEAQETLSAAASSYDVSRLMAGVGLAAMASIASFNALASLTADSATIGFFIVTSLYSVMMFASSYVEEEQHIWYWASGAWLAVLIIPRLRLTSQPLATFVCGLLALGLLRTGCRWNQTGQKHAGASDIVRTYLPKIAPEYLWVAILAAYYTMSFDLPRSTLRGIFPQSVSHILHVAIVGAAYIFKYNFTRADAPELSPTSGPFWLLNNDNLNQQAQIVFALVITLFVALIAGHSAQKKDATWPGHRLIQRVRPLLSILLLTQSRTANVLLCLIYYGMYSCLRHILLGASLPQVFERVANLVTSNFHRNDHTARFTAPSASTIVYPTAHHVTLTTLLLTYASFYQYGNSNAISSIDLSQAYNGLSTYNISAVGILLFLSNWAGPIWWTTAGVSLQYEAHDMRERDLKPKQTGIDAPPSGVSQNINSPVDQLDQLIDDALTSTTNGTTESAGKRRKRKSRASIEPTAAASRPLQTRTLSSLFVEPAASMTGSTAEPDPPYQQYLTFMTFFTATSLAATMLACTVLRTHLFIWTVFSPKYLYAAAWAVGWHLVVNIGWVGTLLLVG